MYGNFAAAHQPHTCSSELRAKGFPNLGNLTWVGFSMYKDVPYGLCSVVAAPQLLHAEYHIVSTRACQASLPGFPSALGYTRVWQYTHSCQSAWWHRVGQASARDGLAKAGLVGTVVFQEALHWHVCSRLDFNPVLWGQPSWEPSQSSIRPCRISPVCRHWARTCLHTDDLEVAVLLGLGIVFFSSQINNPVVVLIFSSLKKIGGLGVDEPKCG